MRMGIGIILMSPDPDRIGIKIETRIMIRIGIEMEIRIQIRIGIKTMTIYNNGSYLIQEILV
jgi:hypothetical protein